VFWERGGFDLIAGNPPWLKFSFEEKGIIAEKFPEVEIKSVTAPQVRLLQAEFFKDEKLKELYYDEMVGTECIAVFMNAGQNYPLLKGQQTNLYKCVLENGFSLLSDNGFMGLLHPEGVYDDPNGQPLRKEIYPRLRYHFQFQNAFNLFAEVAHREKYGVHIYRGCHSDISFYSINNLFHPSTIDGCFIHDGSGLCGGIKVKGDGEDGFVWNVKPHRDRVIRFSEVELKTFGKAFNQEQNWNTTRLVSVHNVQSFEVLKKIANFKNKISNLETKIIECWHETNDVRDGLIKKETKYPDIEKYEFIYSGPHFFVANPLYKTPRTLCVEKSQYDTLDLNDIEEAYVPRTNFLPVNQEKFIDLKGFKIIDKNKKLEDQVEYDNWINYYKLIGTSLLSQAGERTLQPAIIPPLTSHIQAGTSVIFRNNFELVELSGLSASLVYDFYIKSIAVPKISQTVLDTFPILIDKQ
jgi:hypothetical protein